MELMAQRPEPMTPVAAIPTSSTWDHTAVRRRRAARAVETVAPTCGSSTTPGSARTGGPRREWPGSTPAPSGRSRNVDRGSVTPPPSRPRRCWTGGCSAGDLPGGTRRACSTRTATSPHHVPAAARPIHARRAGEAKPKRRKPPPTADQIAVRWTSLPKIPEAAGIRGSEVAPRVEYVLRARHPCNSARRRRLPQRAGYGQVAAFRTADRTAHPLRGRHHRHHHRPPRRRRTRATGGLRRDRPTAHTPHPETAQTPKPLATTPPPEAAPTRRRSHGDCAAGPPDPRLGEGPPAPARPTSGCG